MRKPTNFKNMVTNQVVLAAKESCLSKYSASGPAEKIPLGSSQLLFCSMFTGGKLIYDGVDKTPHYVSDADAFFLMPGMRVEADCPNASPEHPTSCLAVEISRSRVIDTSDRLLSGQKLVDPVAFQKEANSSITLPKIAIFPQRMGLRKLLDRIDYLIDEKHPDQAILIDLSITELLIRLLRYKAVEFVIGQSEVAPDTNWLTAVIDHIRQKMDSELSIDHVARLACMSRSRLYTEFKKHTGYSPGAFHQNLKLQEAAKRLSNGEMITTVCYDLGFSNPSHFNRRFRNLFHCSPSEYRDNAFRARS